MCRSTCNVCLAQLDRAFGYGPKGRGFESSNTREFQAGRLTCRTGETIFGLRQRYAPVSGGGFCHRNPGGLCGYQGELRGKGRGDIVFARFLNC